MHLLLLHLTNCDLPPTRQRAIRRRLLYGDSQSHQSFHSVVAMQQRNFVLAPLPFGISLHENILRNTSPLVVRLSKTLCRIHCNYVSSIRCRCYPDIVRTTVSYDPSACNYNARIAVVDGLAPHIRNLSARILRTHPHRDKGVVVV